jgi:hypothetical protein
MAKRRVMQAFKLNEISAVDHPAQEHALAAIIKRAGDDVTKRDLIAQEIVKRYIDPADGAISFADVLANSEEQARYNNAVGCWYEPAARTAINAMDTSIASILGDANLSVAAKQIQLRTTVEGFLNQINTKWPEIEAALSKAFEKSSEGDIMDKEELAKLQKSVKDLTEKVGTLTTDLASVTKERDALKADKDALAADAEMLKARAKMKDDEKEYMDNLADDEKKKAFVAMKSEERAAEIAKARSGDETVTIEGRTIRKSVVGADQFEIFKATAARIEKQDKEIASERDLRKNAEFTKVAEDKLGDLPGEITAKVAVLKALEPIPAEVRKTLDAMLDAGAKAIKSAFDRLGSGDGKGLSPSLQKARQAFEGKVSEIAKRDNISKTAAMSKARSEFPDEFKAYQGENTATAN